MKGIVISLFVLASACQANKVMSVLRVDSEKFEISPRIIKADDKYYLRYKMKNPGTTKIETRLILMSKVKHGKGYYFLSGPTSFKEFYNLNEMQVQGRLLNSLEKGQMYWLNPDGTETKLHVLEEQILNTIN